ncbi:MAG TPA: hypothetical protein VF407_18330 [Polyangiaceae bacterium]
MWAEIIFSRDDLARALEQAFPLKILLGEAEGEQSLSLSDLGEVTLVADVGLRVQCKALVKWPVLGHEIPVALNALTVVFHPEIGKGPDGDTLVFRISIEHADIQSIPSVLDSKITAAVNAKLAEQDAALSWNFSRTLTLAPELPSFLEPLHAFAMKPAWGKVRINEEALVYAASFHSKIVRRGDEIPKELTSTVEEPEAAEAKEEKKSDAPKDAPTDPQRDSLPESPEEEHSEVAKVEPAAIDPFPAPPPKNPDLTAAGVFGAAAGIGFFALSMIFRRKR